METGNLDSQVIKKALNLKNSAVVFQRWVLQDSKSKIYVISTNRLHLLAKKPPHKVEFSTHILDLQSIESTSSQSVKITLIGDKSPKLDLKFGDDEDALLSISHIIALVWHNFPALDAGKTLKVNVEPGDRSTMLFSFNEAFKVSQVDVGPCNGFSTTYFSICDYFGQPSLAEVAWDIDKIYACHTCTEFDVSDFDNLESKELIPLIATVGYSDWFKSFRYCSVKLGSDVLEAICRVLRLSISLEMVVLKNLHLTKDTVQKLTVAIGANSSTKLKSFDLSGNGIEDKGLSHLCGALASLPSGVEDLSLKNVGFSSKGSSVLGTLLRTPKLTTSLSKLCLADNPLKSEGLAVINEFLSRPNSVRDLDLSNTDCAADAIFGALLRGCLQKLETLNLSGNQFTYKRKNSSQVLPSLQQFFGSAIALREVKLSSTKLPAEAAKAILLGLIGNTVVTSVSLDFSKNELRAVGAGEIGNCFPGLKNLTSLNVADNGFDLELIPFCENVAKNTSLHRLDISQNIGKVKSSSLGSVVEALVEMCLAESLPLVYLSVADNKLKQETSTLFDSLGANNSLQELDISGNAMGDEGARLLAKALQINTRLRILYIDRNGVSHKGYQDIANALKRNYSMQSIPTPIADMSQGLKHYSEPIQRHIHKIEKLLHRNMSMESDNRDSYFRLQQNVMLGFLNQQRIDEMVVNLEDAILRAKEEQDEDVASEVRNSKAVVQEAEKLKDVVHGICMDAINIDKSVKSKMDGMTDDLSTFANELLKKNIIEMLERVRDQCPSIFSNKTEVETLQSRLIEESKVDISPVRDNMSKALFGLVLHKIKEASMSVASVIAEQLTEIVHSTLNTSVTRLQQSMKKKGTKPTSPKAAENKIKKNRLSLLVPDNAEAASKASNIKRRPTFHRNKKDNEGPREVELVLDIDSESSPKTKPKNYSGNLSPKNRERLTTATLDMVKGKEELTVLQKDRVKPAKGRRPPTKTANLAQLTADDAADGQDSTDAPAASEEGSPSPRKRSEPMVPIKSIPLIGLVPEPPKTQKPEFAPTQKAEAPEDLRTESCSSVAEEEDMENAEEEETGEDKGQAEEDERAEEEDEEEKTRKGGVKSPGPKPPPPTKKPTPKPRVSKHKDDMQLNKLKKANSLTPEAIPRSSTTPSREFLDERKMSLDAVKPVPTKRSDSQDGNKDESDAAQPEIAPRPMPKPRVGMPLIPTNVMNEIKQRQQQQQQRNSIDGSMGSPDKEFPKPPIRKKPPRRKSSGGELDDSEEGKRDESAASEAKVGD